MYRGRRNEGYHNNGNRRQTQKKGREREKKMRGNKRRKKGHIPKNDDSKGL